MQEKRNFFADKVVKHPFVLTSAGFPAQGAPGLMMAPQLIAAQQAGMSKCIKCFILNFYIWKLTFEIFLGSVKIASA